MLTGQNGILTKSIEAQKLSYISNEKEAIKLVYTLAIMDKSLDSNQYFLGKQLRSPTLDNVNWDVIVLNDSQEHYGDSWNYISKNTNISNYGSTQYDSYDKRQDAYNEEISYGDVTKFSGYDRQRSNNAKNYIDLNKKAFKFNGNNYIEIYNKDGFDFSNGFTFEFYGNLNDFLYAHSHPSSFCPFIGLWNGDYSNQCYARFGYLLNKQKFHYNFSYLVADSSWPESKLY